METRNKLLSGITLALMLSLIFLSGCMTPGKIAKICATCPVNDSAVKSVVIKEVFIHDTIKPAPIQGPIRYLDNPCANLCDSLGKLKAVDIKDTKNGITTHIKTHGNQLVVETSADSLKIPVDKKETTINKQSTDKQTKTIYIPCTNERTGFDKFSHYCFWILLVELVILILWVIYRIRTGRLRKS